jgi:hypothetical protein
MNLNEMRDLVRRDLRDEDVVHYRWTDDEIDRHIIHALKDFSAALPLEQKAAVATTAGSREIALSGLTDRVMLAAVEYPPGRQPACYRRFSSWGDILTLPDGETPDGSNCLIYYGKLHTLNGSSSTLPSRYEDLVAAGACGYAAAEMAVSSINQVNLGGPGTTGDWADWSKEKLAFFRAELKRLGCKNRVRTGQMYTAEG